MYVYIHKCMPQTCDMFPFEFSTSFKSSASILALCSHSYYNVICMHTKVYVPMSVNGYTFQLGGGGGGSRGVYMEFYLK
jgi:hypothetical protein